MLTLLERGVRSKKEKGEKSKDLQKLPFQLMTVFLFLHVSSRQWSARVVFSISRREWEFLRSISFIETRPRIPDTYSQASRRDPDKISSNLRHRDLLSSLSGFETRTRIPLIWSRFSRWDREFWKLPSFPEIRLERRHYLACNFWEANYIKCRAPHFARCSPILKWPSHVLRASI